MAEPDMTWRASNELRQAAISKIEDAKRKSGVQMTLTSMDFEKQVFQHARAQEDYLNLINKAISRIQQGNNPEVGQPGAVPNAVGMRPVGMQQRPQLTGFPNQQMMARGGALGLPRTEMFGLPQRPQMVGQNQMMVPNPSMMPGNFQHMVKINAPQQGLVQIGTSSGPNSVQGPIPSPAGGHMGPGSGGAPMPSPGSVLQSASPGPHSIAPSPANRTSTGIPSPGNLNTPGNPGSVGSVGGSVGSVGPAVKLSPAEEHAYLEKWKQLQKYIDPLKRMINRIDKDEDRKVDLNKMKNLLDILSDSTKRLPIATLLKCEKVLEKQLVSQQQPTMSHPPVIPLLVSSGSSENLCQPLMDAIANNIKMPMFNHTLQRTFGPAVRALHGPPISVDSPPTRKRKIEDADDGFDIDDLIQGEIARLHYRFIVNLDSNHQSGSKVVHLFCKMEDRNLPNVPPIQVILPENYPHGSPICQLNASEYDTSPFLLRVRDVLTSEINRLTGSYSLTALLNLWDQCVRKACEQVSS